MPFLVKTVVFCAGFAMLASLRGSGSQAFHKMKTSGRGIMENCRAYARVGAALAAALATSVLTLSAYGQTVPDISGTYWATQYNAKIQIVGGGDLPLTPK